MSQEFLDDRRRALEEAFFAQEAAAWRERHRAATAAQSERERLAAASGISEPALLDRLVSAGVKAETLAALSLVPLVLVAWADGTLDEAERKALLEAAAESGVTAGSAAHESFTQWLAAPPPPGLLETWTAYIQASAPGMDPQSRELLKATLIGRARRVAEAAGGFLGLGARISPAEAKMLEQLERSFPA
ncbi:MULTISPECIES: hypothetical protein [Roseomonadaceae]|uniref:TerB family tellurite resistance protein n=1 Tax=Falsiroseomonas oleicola TaxID=2801474 RepID=A0ABS6H5Y8_9PROT|nr:hypothetical protein [Roseomonas oleicola]MBU8543252.1 hypothetical protein [Roseomonas oleicola]